LLTDEIKIILTPVNNSVTAVILVGNSLRSDDGVGPYIAKNLKSSNSFVIFNAKEKPENIIEDVVKLKPNKTIIIDAANFKGKIGEVKIIPNEQLSEIVFSTHVFPLKAIANIIIKDTSTDLYFLGIQPKNMHLGEGLSTEIKASADEIIKFINYA